MAKFVSVETINETRLTMNVDNISYITAGKAGEAVIYFAGPFNLGMGCVYTLKLKYEDFILMLT